MIDFTVESKADAKYKCVSAASIVAKFWRDEELENWRFIEPHLQAVQDDEFVPGMGGAISKDRLFQFGCGYPSDKHTKAWLR